MNALPREKSLGTPKNLFALITILMYSLPSATKDT
jgi:hypothetical protein